MPLWVYPVWFATLAVTAVGMIAFMTVFSRYIASWERISLFSTALAAFMYLAYALSFGTLIMFVFAWTWPLR